MIKLIAPTKQLEKEILDYKLEMIENGDNKLNGCGGLDRFDHFDEWIDHLQKYADRNKLLKQKDVIPLRV